MNPAGINKKYKIGIKKINKIILVLVNVWSNNPILRINSIGKAIPLSMM